MKSANTNPFHRNAGWRRLPVEWLEHGESDFCLPPFHHVLRSRSFSLFERAFTILELMIVVGIIGFIAAMALPHLGGLTKANTMSTALRQMLDDIALARQRALVNRSEVDMVFIPQDFWYINNNLFGNQVVTNLISHQCAAYALVSQRTVGDQPGKAYVHYLTDWRYLPQGIFFSLFQLTNDLTGMPTYPPLNISVTNTTTGVINGWPVTAFPWGNFPFPSAFNGTVESLPYIAFTANGQLKTNGDQFILLNNGSMFYPMNADGTFQFNAPNWIEVPSGNVTNNPNLIHIDWLTGRAKIERNQF